MELKVTNVFMAEKFGYNKQVFTDWKKTGKPELLARFKAIELSAILLKNNITTFEILSMVEKNQNMKSEIIELKKSKKDYEDKLKELQDSIKKRD